MMNNMLKQCTLKGVCDGWEMKMVDEVIGEWMLVGIGEY